MNVKAEAQAKVASWLLLRPSASTVGTVVAVLLICASAHAQNAPPSPSPVQVPPVNVQGTPFTLDQQLQLEGTTAEGYLAKTLSTVGILGPMSIQDMPYSVSVMSRDLIENIQAQSVQDLLKLSPFVQVTQPESTAVRVQAQSRGFLIDTAEDGFHYANFDFGHIDIEDKERVELLDGPSGFANGVTVLGPGGLLNYVLKRPTSTPLYEVTIGAASDFSPYIHGDFGGPLNNSGSLAYRFNIVLQDGDTAIHDQNIRRTLFSGALDWHVTNNVLIQFDASRQDYRMNAPEPIVEFAGITGFKTFVFSPPNPAGDYGGPFSFEQYARNDFGTRAVWDINSDFTLRAGYKYIWSRNDGFFSALLPASAGGNYTLQGIPGPNFEVVDNAAYIALDSKFNTGSIQHKVTTGFFTNFTYDQEPVSVDLFGNVFFQGGCNLSNPQACWQGLLAQVKSTPVVDGGPLAKEAGFDYLNFVVTDQIKFNDQLSAILGLNFATVGEQNYDFSGNRTATLSKSKLTPSASLIYKPLPWITTYATYIQGLENGGIAGRLQFVSGVGVLPVSNPGAAPPTVDDQYEVGAKFSLGNALLTVAVFDLDQATQVFALNSTNTAVTFSNAGRQEVKGGEIALTGKVTDNLTVLGGVTAFDAKITKQPEFPTFVGKEPIGVAPIIGKLYLEYAIDAVPGLALTGGVQYYSSQYINNANTVSIPGVVVGDIGARYTTKLYGRDTIFRLNVTNVANKAYWIGTQYLGDPLQVFASAQVKF